MEALSLAHTRWLFRPKICAANWAAASGERMVEQPRPAEGRGLGHKDGLKKKKTQTKQEKMLSVPLGIRKEDQTS